MVRDVPGMMFWIEPEDTLVVRDVPERPGVFHVLPVHSKIYKYLQSVASVLLLMALLGSFNLFMTSMEPAEQQQLSVDCTSNGLYLQTLGDGSRYCIDPMFPDSSSLDSVEIGEDQHIRETFDGVVEEYRWEAVEQHVVYGWIEESGIYGCTLVISETNLPENWSSLDLVVDDVEAFFPTWCGQQATSEDRNYAEGEHPQDGLWMFDVSTSEAATGTITAHQVQGVTYSYTEWEAEARLLSSFVDDDEFNMSFCMVCLMIPLLALFIITLDYRPVGVEVDRTERLVVRKRLGNGPVLLRKSYEGVDFSSLQLSPITREQSSSDDLGSSGTSYTYHPGFDLTVNTRSGNKVVMFIEGPEEANPNLGAVDEIKRRLAENSEPFSTPSRIGQMLSTPSEASSLPTQESLAESSPQADSPPLDQASSEPSNGAFWAFGDDEGGK